MISLHVASLPALIAFFVNLNLFILIYRNSNRRPHDRVLLFLILAFMFWNLSECALFNARSPETASIYGRMTWTGVSFIGPVFMHFTLAFPRRRAILNNRLLVAILYLPALFFLSLTWLTGSLIKGVGPAAWGSPFDIQYGPSLAVATLYLLFALLFGLYLFYRAWRFSLRGRERVQGKWFFFATLVPITGGLLTNLILPLSGLIVFPLGSSLTAVMSLCLSYGILKYRLISMTPATAADMIVSMLPGIVLLLDNDQKILFANERLLETLEYRRDEIIGRPISSVICAEDRRLGLPLQQWDTRENVESFTVGFLKKDGTVVPLLFNGSIISDGNDAAGIVILGFPAQAPFTKPPRHDRARE